MWCLTLQVVYVCVITVINFINLHSWSCLYEGCGGGVVGTHLMPYTVVYGGPAVSQCRTLQMVSNFINWWSSCPEYVKTLLAVYLSMKEPDIARRSLDWDFLGVSGQTSWLDLWLETWGTDDLFKRNSSTQPPLILPQYQKLGYNTFHQACLPWMHAFPISGSSNLSNPDIIYSRCFKMPEDKDLLNTSMLVQSNWKGSLPISLSPTSHLLQFPVKRISQWAKGSMFIWFPLTQKSYHCQFAGYAYLHPSTENLYCWYR